VDLDVLTAFGLVALALTIGAYGTIIGAGGGFLLVPALAVLFGLEGAEAVGTAALTLALIRVTGAVGYHRQGLVQWPVVVWFALGSGPMALLSGWLLTKRIDSDALLAVIGLLLLVLAGFVVFRHTIGGRSTPRPLEPAAPRPVRLLGGGAAVGVLNGTFAVGGGLVAVPYLARTQRLSAHRAAATTAAAGAVGSAAATVGHTINGSVQWSSAPLLFVGALVGSWVGARRAGRLSERTVMLLLAAGLVAAGLPLVVAT
jgi:uncharacterized membrane protein YfcA